MLYQHYNKQKLTITVKMAIFDLTPIDGATRFHTKIPMIIQVDKHSQMDLIEVRTICIWKEGTIYINYGMHKQYK